MFSSSYVFSAFESCSGIGDCIKSEGVLFSLAGLWQPWGAPTDYSLWRWRGKNFGPGRVQNSWIWKDLFMQSIIKTGSFKIAKERLSLHKWKVQRCVLSVQCSHCCLLVKAISIWSCDIYKNSQKHGGNAHSSFRTKRSRSWFWVMELWCSKQLQQEMNQKTQLQNQKACVVL